jgi:hypothetical protein
MSHSPQHANSQLHMLDYYRLGVREEKTSLVALGIGHKVGRFAVQTEFTDASARADCFYFEVGHGEVAATLAKGMNGLDIELYNNIDPVILSLHKYVAIEAVGDADHKRPLAPGVNLFLGNATLTLMPEEPSQILHVFSSRDFFLIPPPGHSLAA